MTVTLRDDYNEDIISLGDEGTVHIWNLGTRSVLNQDLGGIKLLTPNASGISVVHTNTYAITWKTSCRLGGTVEIYYSTDAGLNWTICAQNGGGTGTAQADDGSFTWDPPAVVATQCLIRIHMTDDISIYDVSDEYFALTA